MADETKTQAELNAEVAAKVVAQDIVSTTSKPEELQAATDALDSLAAAKDPEKIAAAEAEKTAVDEAAAAKAAAEAEKSTDPIIKKAAEEAAARAEVSKRADDYFKDAPALSEKSSPKATESFNFVKIKAVQDISARDAEIDKLKKEVETLTERSKAALTPELEKELNDHRTFRSKLDVEADPRFKAFDKTVKESQEFIYAQLRKSPAVTEDVIKEIQKYGGPENVKLDKLFAAAADPTLQRLVESKIADIEMAKFNKSQAVTAAKENISQYVAAREEQYKKSSTAHTDATRSVLTPIVAKLEWLADKKAEAGADEAAKKSVEEHNQFAAKTKQELEAAILDDSPQMRAILITGMAQLFNLQRIHEASVVKTATLQKSLDEANAQVARFKKASTSRLRDTNSTAPGGVPKPSEKDRFNMRADDALDAIGKQIMEEKAAKGQ
jgi:hypothetical protein